MQSTAHLCYTVDYSKWDRLLLDTELDEDDCGGACSARALSMLGRCKVSIDRAFEESAARYRSEPSEFAAIVDRYKVILSSLASLDAAADDCLKLDLSLGVYLNMSCAYLKLQQWKSSLDCSHKALWIMSGDIYDWNKRLRATYFTVCALLRIEPLRFDELLKAVDDMRTAAQLHRAEISPSQFSEYEEASDAFRRKCKAVDERSALTDRDGDSPSLELIPLISKPAQSHFPTEDDNYAIVTSTTAVEGDSGDCSAAEMKAFLRNASSSYMQGDYRGALRWYRLVLRIHNPIPALTAVAQYGLGACVLSTCSPDECDALSDALQNLLDSIYYFEEAIFAPVGGSFTVLQEESCNAISVLIPDLDAIGEWKGYKGAQPDSLSLHLLRAYRMVIRASLQLHIFSRCDWLWNRAIDVCNVLLLDLMRSMRLNNSTVDDLYVSRGKKLISAICRERVHFLIEKASHCMDTEELGVTCDLHPTSVDLLLFQRFAVLPSMVAIEGYDAQVQLCLVHRELVDCSTESAAALLSFAAHDCILIDIDITPVVNAYKALAIVCMNSTSPKIEAFDLRAHRQLSRIDLAQRAVDCWGQVSALSRHATSTKHIRSEVESYRHRQQCMLADYHAGICTLALEDLALAQRCFESAQSMQRDIDTYLQQRDKTEDCSGYYTACGDLSYHLGHTYFRLGRYVDAVEESSLAFSHYQLSVVVRASWCDSVSDCRLDGAKGKIPMRDHTAQERLRQRQALTLLALADTSLGDMAAVEAVLREIAALCLGPVEHAVEEVQAVKQLMQRLKDQRMEGTSEPCGSQRGSMGKPVMMHSQQLDIRLEPGHGAARDRTGDTAAVPKDTSSRGQQVVIDWDLVLAYLILVAAMSAAVLIACKASRLLS